MTLTTPFPSLAGDWWAALRIAAQGMWGLCWAGDVGPLLGSGCGAFNLLWQVCF